MDPLSEIREKIKRIANGNGSFTCFTAKVTSVDGETCDVELEGMKLTDVRLRAVMNGEDSKILVTPKIGSHVLVVDLSGNLSQLAAVGYSEVEKIEIDATDKIIFNGGNNKGLIQIEKLTQKLNELVIAINAHTHPVVSGSATGVMVSALSPFSSSDYEDTKITH
ncbi:MAG: hypothetical protein IKN61_04105 [Bacteroidaceae bacterium]|nr:hypothetical protein [Bacteroidaceae bacterium]MBR4535943.1 hypothetical protein [Bacteroidales bacterium]